MWQVGRTESAETLVNQEYFLRTPLMDDASYPDDIHSDEVIILRGEPRILVF
jgi:hypothetical protein